MGDHPVLVHGSGLWLWLVGLVAAEGSAEVVDLHGGRRLTHRGAATRSQLLEEWFYANLPEIEEQLFRVHREARLTKGQDSSVLVAAASGRSEVRQRPFG